MRTSLVLNVAVVAMVLSAAAGCSVNPVTGKPELSLISEQQEVAMGIESAPQFEKEFGGKVPDAALQNYVQTLGKKVAAVSDRPELPWEFQLVATKTPNAFALPGGKVFVTAGLFGSLTNERQLVAVLGHEIGHICARHNIQGMQRQMGAGLLVELAGQLAGDKADIAKAATSVVGNMAVLKYSRKDEYQADDLGIAYMERAGFNPWGMVETLQFLMSLGEKDESKFAEMFQTHPLTSERVKKAQAAVTSRHAGYAPSQGDPRAKAFMDMRTRLR
ncbi:MAG: M48 family metallopeptidase [Planctomycetaceae bacterium]|nr:M48 family metallopeptidase [Planctomycetaceae bacterium]